MLRSGAIGTAVGALLLACVGAGALPAPAVAKPIAAGNLIATPAAGKALPPRPVAIRVRAGRRARLGAKLNGRPIPGRLFRPASRGVRRLHASASHGLRHGRNVLLVRTRHPGAKPARAQRVRFRVRGERPLAAAGLDRRVAQHARLSLAGRRSQPRPARRGRPLRYRWTLLRAPRGSKLWRHTPSARKRGARGRARSAPVRNLGPRSRLRRMGRAVPHLRFDHPGIYRLRLTVADPDGRRGADTVTLRADPTPLVPIDTMAKPEGAKAWGVKVGGQFYPDPGANKQWAQLVVLKASTLGLVANKSFACPQATAHPHAHETAQVRSCIASFDKYVTAMKKRHAGEGLLAIVASQRVDGKLQRTPPWQVQPPVGLYEALQAVGGDHDVPPWVNAGAPMLRGRSSFVSTLGGGGVGVQHENYDLEDLRDTGEIRGFLLRDNHGEYSTYASAEHLPFETRAEGSNQGVNVMRIGSGKYRESIPAGSFGGFHVVIAEPQGLSGSSHWFDTGNFKSAEARLGAVREMTSALGETFRSPESPLVFIASVGNPGLRAEPGSRVLADAVKKLVDLLSEHFGATRSRLYRTLDPALSPDAAITYSLAVATSAAHQRTGKALEAAAPRTSSGLNSVPLFGSLTRNEPTYGFEAESSWIGGESVDEFSAAKIRNTAFSKPGSWPEQGNRARAAAIAWVGKQILLDSRRSLFWTQPYSKEFWDPKRKKIEALRYPAHARFGKAAFAWARKELVREIEWLGEAHGFFAELASVFAKTADQAWADVGEIAAKVDKAVQAPASRKTTVEVLLFLEGLREAAKVIPYVGGAVSAVSGVYQVAAKWAKVDAEGSKVAKPFQVAAGEVGKALAKRLETAQDTLEDQLLDVVAADYRKLQTVGICGGLERGCPDPPLEAWQFTREDQRNASQVVQQGLGESLYGALLPVKYGSWLMDPGPYRSTNWNGHQPAGQNIGGWWCPFHNATATGQLAYPLSRPIGSGSSDGQWQVVAYAYQTGTGTIADQYRLHLPSASVTDPLFNPPGKGGLGADPETFYRRSGIGGVLNQHRFTHYPEGESVTRWITKDDPAGVRTASCGY